MIDEFMSSHHRGIAAVADILRREQLPGGPVVATTEHMVEVALADVDGCGVPVPEWDVYGPMPTVALSRVPASAGLAMELEFGVEPLQDIDDAALEDVITSYARMAAWAQANQSRAVAELARRAEVDPRRRGSSSTRSPSLSTCPGVSPARRSRERSPSIRT